MGKFLLCRNGHYYFRIRIPLDLSSIFPAPEILKSLHTKDRRVATIAASQLYVSVQEVFSLARLGFIIPNQARERLDALLGRSQVARGTKTPPSDLPKTHTSPLLSEVITEYVNDKKSGWTGKTKLEYNGYLRLIQDVLRIENVADVTRDTVRTLRDKLSRLPANLHKKHQKKTIAEILRMENIVPMSVTNVNKILTLFSSVMLHCVREGYLTANPAEGIKIPHRKRADEERKAYSRDDIKKLMSALPSPQDNPEKFWIPLIGLYSGMRLGEICSLHLEDIKNIDGVWCFDINAEGDKRLKTVSSKRIVPIHPHLIASGLIILVENLRSQGVKRLWPNLKKRVIDGYYDSFGKWYGRFNRTRITTDPLKSFHSLRHTFADVLKQLGEQEPLIAELMGHTNPSITTGRYGKRYQPHVLLKALRKLDFGAVPVK